jgi:hypothetical protein
MKSGIAYKSVKLPIAAMNLRLYVCDLAYWVVS